MCELRPTDILGDRLVQDLEAASLALLDRAVDDPEPMVALQAYIDAHVELLAGALTMAIAPPARKPVLAVVTADLRHLVDRLAKANAFCIWKPKT